MNELNIAFKEWAVIVDALLAGKHSVIFRKGGIIEEKKTFSVDHQNFLLFPTYFHQEKEDLISSERDNLEESLKHKPKNDLIKIPAYVQVKEVHFLENLEQIKQFQPFGIWSEKCLKERFNWGDHKGIHLILGRVYQLPEPVTLSMKESYGGCKSWIDLEQNIHLEGSIPAISDAAFEEIREKINLILDKDSSRAY